ncbi:hypothetical protein ACFODZ_11875 [Marinicella sediminis]|uniref:Glycosyl transferase n=1 Tax=Marinicella sediminis TaxID=1792834 RepID=A0ABV7JDK3_9GAMM|nr:hypothetical protein [Marinicella sediminis]
MLDAPQNTKKKTYRYEPIERRRNDRRGDQSDRRTVSRDDVKSDRRQESDRRKK